MLHFNEEHPENHNVKITNKKEPYALVWNDPIWELRKKKSVVKDLVDKGYMMIETTHDTIDETNTKYIKFQDNFEDECSNIKDKIEEETEIVIFNESKKIE
jgi:predicted nucleic-acid-binding protein